MKMIWRVAAMLGCAWLATSGGTAWAAETAIVKSDRVNVRGQAGLGGEVITQLTKGEPVLILEEINLRSPRKGEPAQWARIQLPAHTPVWVFAPYISAAEKTVTVNRVNLRGGAGENYSVLGRIGRGTVVKEIRTVNNWMEIEAPTNAYAFVATQYLERTPATAMPETSIDTNATTVATAVPAPVESATPPPTTVETVTTEPAPATAVDSGAAQTPPAPETPAVSTPSTAATPESAPADLGTGTLITSPGPEPAPAPELPRRVVTREGQVVFSRSIQAPTTYALESKETHRIINYLHTEELGLKLKNFAGRKVLVTGEELLDTRWQNTPILEVESIQIVP